MTFPERALTCLAYVKFAKSTSDPVDDSARTCNNIPSISSKLYPETICNFIVSRGYEAVDIAIDESQYVGYVISGFSELKCHDVRSAVVGTEFIDKILFVSPIAPSPS